MTVSSQTSSVSYTGNGATQIFAVPFYFLDETHLVVQTVSNGVTATKVLNTDYTVSGAGDEGGGEVTMLAAPDSSTTLYIARVVPLTQLVSYVANTPFPAATQEEALDQLTMAAQQLSRMIAAALQLSTAGVVAGVSAVLPDPVAGEAIGWNGTGDGLVNIALPDAGTGTYSPGFSGAVASRLVADKLRERISLLDFGAKGDGVTDDTAAVNACIAECIASGKVCFVPASATPYRLTSTISITGKLTLEGEGHGLVGYAHTNSEGTIAPGSWFHIDHTGKGFQCNEGTQVWPVCFKNFGTVRNQPTPNGGAFTPTANDFDFASATDVTYEGIALLNATKGVLHTNNHITVRDLRGQPLQIGIQIQETHDDAHINTVHFWDYWSNDTGVFNYQIANAKGIWLQEVDNPSLADIMTYHYAYGFFVSSGTSYSAGKIRLTNFDFETCGLGGVYFDSTCTNSDIVMAQGHVIGWTGAPVTYASIYVDGAGTKLSVSNVACVISTGSCIKVVSATAKLRASNVTIDDWAHGGGVSTAISAVNGADVRFANRPMIGVTAGATAIFDGGTGINCPLDSGSFSGTTDASGFITVSHNGGIAPRCIQVGLHGDPTALIYSFDSTTATSFRCKARTISTGAVLASTAINGYYAVWY